MEIRTATALKALGRIATAWGLTPAEAAALTGLPEPAWRQAQAGAVEGVGSVEGIKGVEDLTPEQLLRASALIGLYAGLERFFSDPIARTWMTSPNTGPLFGGARPVDALIRGGLPALREARAYVDGLGQGL